MSDYLVTEWSRLLEQYEDLEQLALEQSAGWRRRAEHARSRLAELKAEVSDGV